MCYTRKSAPSNNRMNKPYTYSEERRKTHPAYGESRLTSSYVPSKEAQTMKIVAERWASLTGLTLEQAAKDLMLMKTFFFPDREKTPAGTEVSESLSDDILPQIEDEAYEDENQICLEI